MKRSVALKVLSVALLSAAPIPAFAHHSFAMFDQSKTVVLTGVVKEFQWTNPHSWVQLEVAKPGAAPVNWSIESGSPSALARQGWKRTSFKPGDTVSITINPLRSGQPGGSFIEAKFPNGTVLNRRTAVNEGQAQAN